MSFLNKNSLILGLAIGLLFPLFGSSLVFGIFDLMVTSGVMDEADMSLTGKRMRTIFLIGICTNVYWIRRYNRPFSGETLRGVIIATMLLSFIWFGVFYSDLYSS